MEAEATGDPDVDAGKDAVLISENTCPEEELISSEDEIFLDNALQSLDNDIVQDNDFSLGVQFEVEVETQGVKEGAASSAEATADAAGAYGAQNSQPEQLDPQTSQMASSSATHIGLLDEAAYQERPLDADIKQLWEESASSSASDSDSDDDDDDEDEAKKPEVYHTNRPGKGKRLTTDSSDDGSGEGEGEGQKAVEEEKNGKKCKYVPSDKDEGEQAKRHKPNELAVKQLGRNFKKIPIFVADYHNDVMVFLHRAMASRHLRLFGNVVLHFDSHPDMVVSTELTSQTCYSKQELMQHLSIENWIIPACFTGQFSRVIWLKNSWAKQIDVGRHEFYVGSVNDQLAVDLPNKYFMAEGSYRPRELLYDPRHILLDVCEMDTQDVDPNDLELLPADSQRLILDIDLDFFSTNNPFLDIYTKANCYAHLVELFKYDWLDDPNDTAHKRRAQLEALKAVFEHLERHRSLSDFDFSEENVLTPSCFAKIEALISDLIMHYKDSDINWIEVYDAGCTTADDGLPHHPTEIHELEQHFERFKRFLERLPFPPVCVTISTSSTDNYTPIEMTPHILDCVLRILQHVFGDRIHSQPIHYNDTEDFDIMKL